MPGWDALVAVMRAALFVTAHLLGGSMGGAIAVVAIAARVLLLPLTLRLAVERRAVALRMAALKPERDRLRARYRKDPLEQARRTAEFQRTHGISPFPKGTWTTALLQLPLGAALYQAIRNGVGHGRRFLWIADLSRPDVLLAVITAAITAAGTALSMPPAGTTPADAPSSTTTILVGAAITLAFTLRLASGVGIYWATSSVVTVIENAVASRTTARPAKAPVGS